jgi:rhodanese-related sulfurtransferase
MTRMSRVLAAFVPLLALASSAADLPPAEFMLELQKQGGVVLDVRTPGEVAKGTLEGASVIDFNAGQFEKKVALLSRERPVFVYCASGRRSASAAEAMGKLGFKHVYNLAGGIKAWQAEGFPVTEPTAGARAPRGEVVTPDAFDALLKKDKRVLVDFQTPWCTPCQKMGPVVDALATSVKGVKVLKVDIDASEALAAREKVQGVPVFVLYVDGKEKARLSGERERAALEALAAKK